MHVFDHSVRNDKIMQDMTEERIEEGSVWMAHPVPQASPRDIETAYKDREDATPYDPTYWEENKLAIEKLIEADRKRAGWKELV